MKIKILRMHGAVIYFEFPFFNMSSECIVMFQMGLAKKMPGTSFTG